MNKSFLLFAALLIVCISDAQKVGIGTTTPATKLEIKGVYGNPAIPGNTSTGVLRISVSSSNVEAIDIGKMGATPYAAWIQAGFIGQEADPISLQPSGGNVGIGTTNPGSSAALDISSTTQGFLPPRLTYAQRNLISNPVAGLITWCSNCGIYGELQVYRGTMWINMLGNTATKQIEVGDPANPGNGNDIIAYIFQPGDAGYIVGETHGLITTFNDLSTGAEWGCNGTGTMAAGTLIGTGHINTYYIVSSCFTNGIAAELCYNLEDLFHIWHLPSKDELNTLYINRVAIGNFTNGVYWSSSEVDVNNVWFQNFSTSGQGYAVKNNTYNVRPVRSF